MDVSRWAIDLNLIAPDRACLERLIQDGNAHQKLVPRTAGLVDGKAPGQTPKLNAEQRAELASIVEAGPTPAIHGVVRWQLADLAQWVWEEFRISISPQTLSRELRALGYRKLSARPRPYAQDGEAAAASKKTSPP